MKLSKGNRDLILHGSLVKAVFAIAIPVVVNSFLQTMYNLTDTYWLGQLSVDYLAAINLVSPVQNTVINFGSGVTVAGSTSARANRKWRGKSPTRFSPSRCSSRSCAHR
jgi:Na+-driven multidrug efflux pump